MEIEIIRIKIFDEKIYFIKHKDAPNTTMDVMHMCSGDSSISSIILLLEVKETILMTFKGTMK